MQTNFYPNALEGVAKGIQYGADAVAPTLGVGSNVIIESKFYPSHKITNDAQSIIQSLELTDPLEKRGLAFLKEGADAATAQSGDGRTTMVLLLNAILKGGIEALKEISPLQLKKELDECLPIILKSLDEQTKKISVEEVSKVAEIAGESQEIGQVLGEIYKEIGADGIVHLEGSGTYNTSFSLIKGIRFGGTGYLSPYMANDEEARKAERKETQAIYEKPEILVTKRKITTLNDINPLLGALVAQGKKSLVIFTDDMDSEVARLLVELQKDPLRKINVLVIKAPTLWKTYVFEDFAKVTGSTIVEDATGVTFKNLQLDHLGTCDTLICDKEETTLIGTKEVPDHIEELKKEGTTDAKLRLSWLTTKTAILKLGAKSETELSYLMLKCKDAIHSSRQALAEGIVAGGGVALKNAITALPDSIGGKVLKQALTAPITQICANGGFSMPSETFGEDIVDASLVVKSSIKNALGIASTLLTISSVICLMPPSPEELASKATMRPLGF